MVDSTPTRSIPPAARIPVENSLDGLLEVALERLTNSGDPSLEEALDQRSPGTTALPLDLSDQLRIAQAFAEDFGLVPSTFQLDDLGAQIESMADGVIHSLALKQAELCLQEVEQIAEKLGVGWTAISRFDSAHSGVQRIDQEGRFTIYRYGHTDVYEVDLHGMSFFLERPAHQKTLSLKAVDHDI